MTIDEIADKLGQDLSLKDAKPRQKKPFQVVLVDIKKAAHGVIHCVKKPLEENDLKFVALSYRWGELHEALIDTGVGYTATITSFDLKDFYLLCRLMTFESDTKHINYVWVDAICVDQSPAKRKATIHQMSNIYDRATYILAVPDLHLTYLKGVSLKNEDTIKGSTKYYMDLYHLLHGHASQLDVLDKAFLDDAQVPTDPPVLRQLLLQDTSHFAYGLMEYTSYTDLYCPVQALDHICETTTTNQERRQDWKTWIKGSSKHSNGEIHQCDKKICPLDVIRSIHIDLTNEEYCQFLDSQWKSKILERSNSIRQSMEFLVGLIKDWSTRVWVISEFNIAKKKNNLKYWFTQLSLDTDAPWTFERQMGRENFTFFKFDFHSLSNTIMNVNYYENDYETEQTRTRTSNPVYIQFHYTLHSQLSRQTFLQNILISKASKNEDRFYSILPFSPYQDRNLEVSHWNINTMPSVKLKLYDIMHTKDKLALLFLSGDKEAMHSGVLPTFATSTLTPTSELAHRIHRPDVAFLNFDVKDPSTIMLYHHHHKQTNNKNNNNDDDDDDAEDGIDSSQHYLRLKPKEYLVLKHAANWPTVFDLMRSKWPIFKRLGVHADNGEDIPTRSFDLVSIPLTPDTVPNDTDSIDSENRRGRYIFLTLIGCLVRNKWILLPLDMSSIDRGERMICHGDDDNSIDNDSHAKAPVPFFDIY